VPRGRSPKLAAFAAQNGPLDRFARFAVAAHPLDHFVRCAVATHDSEKSPIIRQRMKIVSSEYLVQTS
jgi:hypothetical protein